MVVSADTNELIGAVGDFIGALFFWLGAVLASDRLLSHFERRFQQSGAADLAPWYKDHRLLFYELALGCSLAYCVNNIYYVMAPPSATSSVRGDAANALMVAAYLSMITMVWWVVIEGCETARRLTGTTIKSGPGGAAGGAAGGVGGGAGGGRHQSQLKLQGAAARGAVDVTVSESAPTASELGEEPENESSTFLHNDSFLGDDDNDYGTAANVGSRGNTNVSTAARHHQSSGAMGSDGVPAFDGGSNAGRGSGGRNGTAAARPMCDRLYDMRAMLSCAALLVMYISINLVEYLIYTTTTPHHYEPFVQWVSSLISFCFGVTCIVQCVHTYRSFKDASEDLARLFMSIFALLAFFLVLRALLVMPMIQGAVLNAAVAPAVISTCDAISIVVLLYRVPKSK